VYIDDVRFVETPCHHYPFNSHPDYCYTRESATCDFEDSTFCSWRAVDDDWDFVKTSSGNTLLQLKNNAARGKLRSQTICSNSTNAFCLSFRYAFNVHYSIGLRFDIVDATSSMKRKTGCRLHLFLSLATMTVSTWHKFQSTQLLPLTSSWRHRGETAWPSKDRQLGLMTWSWWSLRVTSRLAPGAGQPPAHR
jgi:hypothetical protein